MIADLLRYPFLQNALIGALLASVVCGIIGTVVVEKRLVMLSSGIAHTAFGGIGFGYFLSIEPILGALFFAVVSAVAITRIKRSSMAGADALTGMFWSAGMALGILFIALTPGYPPDMNKYLFGDILTISRTQLQIIAGTGVIVALSFILFFDYWRAYLFDEEFAKVIGLNTAAFEYYLFLLVALSTVALIQLVGIILVMALLTIPPTMSRHYFDDFKTIILSSIGLGILFSTVGLTLSYYLDIPSGATIILVSITGYLISHTIKPAA